VDLAHVFLPTDLLDRFSWGNNWQKVSYSWRIPSTERIHKPRNTTAHKVKHEALSQFDIKVCVSERIYYRSVQIHCFEDESTTDRFNPIISGDEITTDQFNPLN
jgi:hypothetical protein